MKKLLSILSLITFLSFSIQSFACLPGGISISTQKDIDDFPANYPGCTIIEGNVYIEDDGTDPITNFNGFSSITQITGYLDIEECPSISNFSGFDNLQHILGDFVISYTSITSFGGIGSLQDIGGNVWILDNELLNNIDDFDNVTLIGGNLEIQNCTALTDIAGFESLTDFEGYISIRFNENLDDISGIMHIVPSKIHSSTMGHKDLEITNNEKLSECNIQNVCNFLGLAGITTDIHDNKVGCNSVAEIEASCATCLSGGITLTSQADIDNFATNYSGCTTIDGELLIKEDTEGDITNLNGLSNITAINGNLEISGNQILENISGLSGIKTIDGNLSIRSNPDLSKLDGLSQLSQLTGTLKIDSNFKLIDIKEFINLTSIGNLIITNNNKLLNLEGLENITTFTSGGIQISNNNALVNFKKLKKLTSINGFISVTNCIGLTSLEGLENIDPNSITIPVFSWLSSVKIKNNPNLSHCDIQSICGAFGIDDLNFDIESNKIGCDSEAEIATACTTCITGNINIETQEQIDDFKKIDVGCTAVDGNLIISETNPGMITNLNGLNEITAISGHLGVYSNIELTNLSGMTSLTTVGRTFEINGNNKLQEIGNLPNLSSIQSLSVRVNPLLSNLEGLENITTLNSLVVTDNSTLQNLEGLNQLTTTEARIEISSNTQLNSLNGLNSLTTINGSLYIRHCENLTDISGLNNLTSIGQNLSIVECSKLTSLSPLHKITSVHQIRIDDNPLLTSLEGLHGITTVGNRISINENNTLETLNAFRNITDFSGGISIIGNDVLDNISGLQYIDPNSINEYYYEDLRIIGNPALSDCAIDNICNLLNISGKQVEISNNKEGCNSIIEVEFHCQENLCTSFTSHSNGQTNVNSSSNLSWESSPNADGYKLRIGTSAGGSEILELTDLGNETSFNPDENFPCGVLIYAKVIPYNTGGDALNCSEIGFRTESMTQADAGEDDSLCSGHMPATITATGGDTYQWSPTIGLSSPNTASSSATPSETTVYTVTVSRDGRCPSTDIVTVFSYPNPEISLTISNETANNANDGSILAEVTGGGAPYTYDWSNGETTQTISNLAPNSYSVTVNDDNGCFSNQIATITSFGCPTFTINEEIINASCHGVCDAQINITEVTNGIAPFTYEWSNGKSIANLVDLCAGEYQVTVTDSKNCSFAKSFIITESDELIINISGTNETGNGFSDGTASSTTTGGTSPYIYAWSNGETTQNITSLSADTYVLTVTDTKGCTAVANINIVIFDCPTITINATATNETGNDMNDGTASCNPAGGIAPYIYLWSNNDTSQSISNLGPGSYSLTVTDSKGCTASQTITVVEYGCSEFTIEKTIENVSCFEACDGLIEITNVANGVAPYTYVWSNENTSNKIESLCPAMYVVTITDANGCSFSKSYNITEPNEIIITLDNKTDASNTQKGSISITTNDDGNYIFNWSHSMGFTSNTEDIVDLVNSGCYTVLVTNSSGCSKEAEFCIESTVATLNHTELESQISLFPNPASSNFAINFGNILIKKPLITIVDLTGKERIVNYQIENNNQVNIDLKNISTGLNIVKIKLQNQHIIYKKIMIIQ